MFKSKMILIIALAFITLSCTRDDNVLNESIKLDQVYTLQNQLVDSISVYTDQGRIEDPNAAMEIVKSTERDFPNRQYPKEINYSKEERNIKFLNNSNVEILSSTKEPEQFDFNLEDNRITVLDDTLISYGEDEDFRDNGQIRYNNRIKKYKPLLLAKEKEVQGYKETLVTKYINTQIFYTEGNQIVEPRIFYLHKVNYLGQNFIVEDGELNNELSENAYEVLNPGDYLIVYHVRRIYR